MTPSASLDGTAVDIVRVAFRARPEDISRQLATLGRAFDGHGLTHTVRDNVTLVLGEVLNNIAEHATSDDTAKIELRIVVEEGRLHVQTEDSGRVLPGRLLGMPSLPDMGTSVEDLPEGGFGWFIIHSLVDDMVYERHAGSNRLSFSFARH